jgi:hypothetical protein
MRLRKNFLIGVGSFLIAIALVGALVLWRLGFFTQNFGALTDRDLAAAVEKMRGPSPAIQTAPERVEPGRRVRLAIGSVGLPTEQQSRNVSDLVLTELNDAKDLEMVERQALDKVLGELQLSAAGLVRANDAVRAGKLLRADWFLLGTPAIINGTNVAVVRIVDARTGVMRDAAMIANSTDTQTLASHMAAFVRRSRQDAANPRPKTYLGIGGFEDVSLNNRQAALPGELRSYLTAAYQGSGRVTMLEREFVNTLLREMYLDLAGLTDESNTNAPRPMQAAYWMVDGYYQSYETTNLQVELVLNVRRMFGGNKQIELRDKSGEPFFRSVRASIDRVIEQDKDALVFSRLTEVRSLLQNGRELARIGGRFGEINEYVWVSYEGYNPLSQDEMARRLRNTTEAVRSFETVLLLDPTNREARICLATCFRKTLIERLDDARDYYRQVIDAPIEDRWSDIARQALVRAFEWPNPSESRLQWFENAAYGSANPAAVAFYKAQAKRAAEDATIRRGGTSEAERLAEVRLFERLKAFDIMIHGGLGMYSADMGMDPFSKALGNDRALVARRLADLFPKMRAQFPDAAPYFLANIVTFQVETNAPIIAEFERTLDWCVEHPDKLPKKGMSFWAHLRSAVFYWASDHHYNEVALKVLETISRAAAVDPAAKRSFDGDHDRLELAFCYMACQRWSNSLSIFELYTNRPIELGARGPWGEAFTIVLPNKQAALCREKLGLPKVIDPREFQLGEPCLHFHDPKRYSRTWGANPVIAAAPDGLWIGINDHLMCLDFDLHTNFVVQMPSGIMSPFSAIYVESSKIWLGTAGSGLIEFDKATKKTGHVTEEDGLLMNHVSALRAIGDTLWIGYGNGSGGGLGKLDLKTRNCTSFTASLSTDSLGIKPPRSPVTEIRPDRDGNIWFMAQSTPMRYRIAENVWEALPNENGGWVSCYELDGEQLIKALRLTQVELTIEAKPKPGMTNTAQKTTRLLSVEEAAQLEALLRTNGSGQRISGSRGGSLPDRGAFAVRALRDGSERRLLDTEALPSFPTTVTLAGHDLWVGGQGFVALVDLDANKIKKLAYLPTASVDQIQLGGGCLWVQCDKHIYRTRL